MWRLIRDGACDGDYNMALDTAIADAVAAGESPPTLRIYRWNRPTISVGRLQNVAEGIDLAFCEEHDVPLVRRPTGGRAILHKDDVTYSVAVKASDIASGGSVVESYKWISRGLVAGLVRVGIDAEMGNGRDSRADRKRSADCFRSTARSDVMAEGRKVIGSAQCRRRGAILQQGTIPLQAKPAELRGVFRDRLPDHPWLIADPGVIEEAIIQGFGEVGVELSLGEVSDTETKAALSIVASAEWKVLSAE